MIRGTLVTIAAVLFGGASLGWVTATPPRGAMARSAAEQVAPRHGGEMARAAAERLQVLAFVVPPTVESVAEAPRPPDIAQLFRRDLTAIEQSATGPVAWIVDRNRENRRRGLRRGDLYQDGWHVAAVRRQSVDLRRGAETRRVELFAPLPGARPEGSP